MQILPLENPIPHTLGYLIVGIGLNDLPRNELTRRGGRAYQLDHASLDNQTEDVTGQWPAEVVSAVFTRDMPILERRFNTRPFRFGDEIYEPGTVRLDGPQLFPPGHIILGLTILLEDSVDREWWDKDVDEVLNAVFDPAS